ncbi:PQQ-dependent sugar dehydrogenase [Paraglaciecola sp. 25GB23A]|uniref:PQQ-dependent sugar dehydrogenase n=1 Tax=Paraglaciecola sp. 25GB23A TaxID=3156068 RepID=UPI0032AEA98D
MMKNKLLVALQVKFLVSTLMLLTFSLDAAEQGTRSNAKSDLFNYQISPVAEGLSFPWSLAFLPNDELLVTERSGNLRKIIKGQVSEPISGLPDDVYIKSQGGLLDVVLHPNFLQNGWIYLSYAAGTDEKNALKVMRAKLNGLTLTEQQVLFTVTPAKDTPVHFAGRMVFLPDNSLLITSGDGFDYREQAQRLDSLLGKIIRINDDGTVPLDNPFSGQDNMPLAEEGSKGDTIESKNYIYSLGHRNAQGLIYDPVRTLVFSHEHGPAGGDEVNIISSGNNYGWPVITNGLDYSGARISPFTEYPGMQQPWLDWTPSIAPSSLVVYYGPMFADLQGDLLVTSLKFKQVYWLHVESNKVIKQSVLFSEIGQRLRDIKVHSDGSIYILTDSAQGQIFRISAQP